MKEPFSLVFNRLNFIWTLFEISYIIQFFQVIFQQQKFKVFKINLYDLTEEIMGASTGQVIKLLLISPKIYVGEQSTLSV